LQSFFFLFKIVPSLSDFIYEKQRFTAQEKTIPPNSIFVLRHWLTPRIIFLVFVRRLDCDPSVFTQALHFYMSQRWFMALLKFYFLCEQQAANHKYWEK